MRLDKEFKNGVNQEIAEGSYILRKVLTRGVVLVLLLSIIIGLGTVGYKKWKVGQDYKIFKQSVTYNEGILDDLAKYKYELETSSDNTSKAAIADLVNSRFANYDETKIENKNLVYFLRACRNGEYAKLEKDGK